MIDINNIFLLKFNLLLSFNFMDNYSLEIKIEVFNYIFITWNFISTFLFIHSL